MDESQMLYIIQNGIPKPSRSKKIVVVGAGMAGLVAATLLKQAGHDITVLEARSRVGGRVFTMRGPFSDDLYMDAGAMRIPEVHSLVFAYLRKFNLPVNQFLNIRPNDVLYANNVKTRQRVYEQNPQILRFPVDQSEKGKTARDLLVYTLEPIIRLLQQNPKNWDWLVKKLDSYSLDDYLRFNPFGRSLSEGAIDMIKVLLDVEAFAELSFLDIFTHNLRLIFLNPNLRFFEVKGGNDNLPNAFVPLLKDDIFYNYRMTRILQKPNEVSVDASHVQSGHNYTATGDLAIVTLPFSIMRFIELDPYYSFSYLKRKAIRELHYAVATKIGLEFKTPFWEKFGIRGGRSVTDMPIRFSYYPSHGIGQSKPAVVVASYTWEDDAIPWESLTERQRVLQTLDDFERLFGNVVYEEFFTGASYSWGDDPYAGGAFPVFKPGQATSISSAIASPEGRVHFAGDHTSSLPGWIQGAIESGIRVALEVNARADLK